MKKLHHIFAILMLTLFVSNARSQTTKSDSKPDYNINLVDNKEVLIEFNTKETLSNVLILIVDSFGKTLFLDNQKDFKGVYKCSIDMSMYTKGDYFVNIKTDEDQKQAKLSIR